MQERTPKTSKLLIFDEQVYYFDGLNYYGSEPHTLFLTGLKGHFDEIILYARVQHAPSSFAMAQLIPADIKIQRLPELGVLGGWGTILPHRLLRIFNSLKKEYSPNDYIYLSWPHPLSLGLHLMNLAGGRKMKMFFVAKQTAGRAISFSITPWKRMTGRELTKMLEGIFRRWCRDEPLLAIGRKMYEKYKATHKNTQIMYFTGAGKPEVKKEKTEGKEVFRLLCIEKLASDSGLDYMLEALDSLIRLEVPIQLDILGEGTEMLYLRKLTEKLKLTDKVHFHGDVADPALLGRFYQLADLVIVPSLNPGMKIFTDAMVFSLPLVAIQSEQSRNFLKHNENAWIVSPFDNSELVEAIYKLYSDKDLRLQLGQSLGENNEEYTREYQQARFASTIKNFDWEKTQQKEAAVIKLPKLQWIMRIFT